MWTLGFYFVMMMKDMEVKVLLSIEDSYHKYIDYHVYHLDDQYNHISGHSHHRFEISLTVEGEGQYTINHKTYNVKTGDIFIIGNDINHKLAIASGQQMKNMVFHFEPWFIWSGGLNQMNRQYLRCLIGQTKTFCHRLPQGMDINLGLRTLLLDCAKEFEGQSLDYDLLIKAHFMTMLVRLNRYYASIGYQQQGEGKSKIDYYRMDEVMKHINSHYTQPIRLEELAGLAHLEPSYFSKVFKEINGISPIAYIHHVRVEQACKLLRDYKYTLEQVSWKCGFKSYSNFVKVFKKIRNDSPSAYRKLWHGHR